MSKFITEIPVDFDALIKAVPRNTYIYSARLSEDRKTVNVVWDNPALESPVAGEWPFPIDNLRNGTLPERVKLAPWAQPIKAPEAIVEPPAKPTGKKGKG